MHNYDRVKSLKAWPHLYVNSQLEELDEVVGDTEHHNIEDQELSTQKWLKKSIMS